MSSGCALDGSRAGIHLCPALPNTSSQPLSRSSAREETSRQGVVVWHIHHCSVRRDSGDAHKRFCLWNCLDCYKDLRFVLPGCKSAWKWFWQTGQAVVPGREVRAGNKGVPFPFSGVRGWERQECCLSRLHPKLDTGIFWQVFTPKRCKDVPGPDPKVLQALPSDLW